MTRAKADGQNGQQASFKLPDTIVEGERNHRLYQLGRSLHAKGSTEPEILASIRTVNASRCRPPLGDAELQHIAREAARQADRSDFRGIAPAAAPQPVTPQAETPAPADSPTWALFDAADAWTFSPVDFAVESLVPLLGVIWWGGMPKRFKSMLCLYICLAIASRRQTVAEHFAIRHYPKFLYIAREDGGPRLQDRRDDIFANWSERPEPGAIRFLIRPRFDLLNVAHMTWLRETCVREGITVIVLDTWTALSPGADPLAPRDQAALAAAVVELAEAI